MRKNNKLRSGLLTAIMLLLCLSACNVRRPGMVLSNSQMADVLYDYHMAKSMIRENGVGNDEMKQAYMEYVYQKHNITEEVFDSSLAWYSRNPDAMMSVYDQIFKRMDKVNTDIKDRIAERDNQMSASISGDSVNLWTEPPMQRMSGRPFENLLSFKLTADNYYEYDDTLHWSMNYHFMNGAPDASRPTVMMLQIWYDRDSMISTQRTVLQDGMQTLTLQNDSLGVIKTVQGFVYYPRQEDSTRFLLLDNISLIRRHPARTEAEDSIRDTRPLTRPVRVSR